MLMTIAGKSSRGSRRQKKPAGSNGSRLELCIV
jgi:hypothetical protein